MTREMKEKILAKVNDMPPLPMVIYQLMDVMKSDNCSARDITKVLSTDYALTSKLLKLANSAFYGFPKKVTTITRAVVIVGFSAIKQMALGYAAYNNLAKTQGEMNCEDLWHHAFTCAVASQSVAEILKYDVPEEAFVSALLQDIGVFVMLSCLPNEYELVLKSGKNRIEAEREIIGIDHTEVGNRLLEKWKLPRKIVEVSKYHHRNTKIFNSPTPLLLVTTLGSALAYLKGSKYCTKIDEKDFNVLIKYSGLSYSKICASLDKIEIKVNETHDIFQLGGKNSRYGYNRNEFEREIYFLGKDPDRIAWITGRLRNEGFSVKGIENIHEDSKDEKAANIIAVDLHSFNLVENKFLQYYKDGSQLIVIGSNNVNVHLPEILLNAYKLPFLFTSIDILNFLKAGDNNGI